MITHDSTSDICLLGTFRCFDVRFVSALQSPSDQLYAECVYIKLYKIRYSSLFLDYSRGGFAYAVLLRCSSFVSQCTRNRTEISIYDFVNQTRSDGERRRKRLLFFLPTFSPSRAAATRCGARRGYNSAINVAVTLANNGGPTSFDTRSRVEESSPRNNNERSCFMRGAAYAVRRDAINRVARGVPYF